ncbi:hypothetical protein [Phaeobacter sp. C3_T13_0]|uniref:hypothetical protein n=1 Tax=Phaeobacter cretensis TaxID=3342641 RepID=UPI0039BC5C84
MTKHIAIIDVVALAGFGVFGYVAQMAERFSDGQMTTVSLLGAAGLIIGALANLKRAHVTDLSAYVKITNQRDTGPRNRAQQEGSI